MSSETARSYCRSSEHVSCVFYEPRIIRPRTGFQRIRIAVRLMPCLWEDDEVDGGAVETLPHAEEADHVRTQYHHPGAALVR
jgi:hypothetical protein